MCVFRLTTTLAVLKMMSDFVLPPPPGEGPGGGSGLSFSCENRRFGTDSGPDSTGNKFVLWLLALSAARMEKRLSG